jgi:hypothetical protein
MFEACLHADRFSLDHHRELFPMLIVQLRDKFGGQPNPEETRND